MVDKQEEKAIGPLGFYQKPEAQVTKPRLENSDASLEYASTAKTIAGVLHKPETFDDKLIHSYVGAEYSLDMMMTAAIPYTMDADYVNLKLDSAKAVKELEEINTRKPIVSEEEIEEATVSELEEQEITDQDEWDTYWSIMRDQYRFYVFEKATAESRILTEDDILAWQVMAPFCQSLPEKLSEAWMAGKESGARAGHGVENIGSILHRETMQGGEGVKSRIKSWLTGGRGG